MGALGLLAGCTGVDNLVFPARTATPRTASSQLARGGTLRIAKAEDVLLNGLPHFLAPANFQIANLIYDRLVYYDAQFRPQPQLAVGWEWSDDSRQLTLHMRPGVRFHTGRPFTSQDARFNIERLRDPTVGSQLMNYAQLMDVSAPSPDTLVVRYDAPARSTFDALSMMYVVDPQTLDETRAGRSFVGTGPFRFQEWRPGDRLRVLRNDSYWQTGKPYLEAVEIQPVPDRQAALSALETEAVDWITGVPGPDARRLQSDPAYQVLTTGNGGTFYYLGLDVATPELADKRVRQALGYAFNRQRMVDTALTGFGRPASAPWPTQSAAFSSESDAHYTYDTERAQRMLNAAGWSPDTLLPIFVSDGVGVTAQMAELAQDDLLRAGVRSTIHKLGQADFVSRLQRGQFRGAWLLSLSWMQLSPPTVFHLSLPLRVPNASNFASSHYTTLIDRSLAATNDQDLRQTMHELTETVLDEAFILILAEGSGQQSGPEVARSSVRNIVLDRFSQVAYQDLWLSR